MPRKPPVEERKIILMRDQRRRYGARLFFSLLHPEHIGTLKNVSLLLADGTLGRIRPSMRSSLDLGFNYELDVEGFPTAAEAEDAGMRAAQALLLTAIDLDFGVRFDYTNHHPSTIYDRTVESGEVISMLGVISWPETVVLETLSNALQEPERNRKLTLSMELLASSQLEANDRAKFIMAVSALEPLASSQYLGTNVDAFVTRALADLQADSTVPSDIKPSLEGRLRMLRKESVRQSLRRLCDRWFPENLQAAKYLDYVYKLRSELLHEGAASDPDILFSQEIPKVRNHVRRIYEQEFGREFHVPTIA